MRCKDGFIYQFHDFKLNPSEHCLQQGGEAIYLRPKTFETLLYLIERHGHLVEKRELLDEVWADTIVTEGTLTQCIKEIRAALRDDPARPRFIKTIPRVGYKFIAPVRTVPDTEDDQQVAESARPGAEEFPAPAPTLSAEDQDRKRFLAWRLWRYPAILVGAAVAGFLVYSLVTERQALSFSARDWVLVADFANYTGKEVFAAALRTALERELSSSRYVNVVPTGRVLDDLGLMKRDLNARIDEALGREICLRDGEIRALLSGSIEEIGGAYEISVKVIDPAKGRLVVSLSEGADGDSEVLPAIRRLARKVRRALGESLSSIAKTEEQLERVTTPSLQALALYSKGWQFANQFDWQRARAFLEQAVQSDSSFAMAHLILGYAYQYLGKSAESRAHFARAAQLVDRVTDRERYFILGSYASSLGDFQKAIEYYELLVQLYPDDYWGHQNLSLACRWTGNLEGFRKHKKACVRIRPNYAVNHSDLGVFALFVEGDVQKAHAEFLRVLELNPDYPLELVHLSDAFLKWMHGDLAGAEARISVFLSTRIRKLLPDFQVTGRWFAARFYLFEGRNDKALQLLHTALAHAEERANRNLAAWTQLELALSYWELGNDEEFRHLIAEVARQSVGLARVDALGWLAIYFARAGQMDRARSLRQDLWQERRMMPADIIHPPLPDELARAKRAFSTQIEAEMALARGDTEKAILHLNRVIELVPPSQLPAMSALDPRLYLVAQETLARVYQRRHDREAASAACQAIIRHKALTITVPAASPIWLRAFRRTRQMLGKGSGPWSPSYPGEMVPAEYLAQSKQVTTDATALRRSPV